jgi:hypothetical protein
MKEDDNKDDEGTKIIEIIKAFLGRGGDWSRAAHGTSMNVCERIAVLVETISTGSF